MVPIKMRVMGTLYDEVSVQICAIISYSRYPFCSGSSVYLSMRVV